MDFMAKMHQIRFRLGLRPRAPAGGAYSAHRPPSCISGPTSKGRVGRGGEGREESVPIVRVLRAAVMNLFQERQQLKHKWLSAASSQRA